jgi:hypothetical protein
MTTGIRASRGYRPGIARRWAWFLVSCWQLIRGPSMRLKPAPERLAIPGSDNPVALTSRIVWAG